MLPKLQMQVSVSLINQQNWICRQTLRLGNGVHITHTSYANRIHRAADTQQLTNEIYSN